MSDEPKVILREQRDQGDYRYLSAQLTTNGDLVFEGQDLGPSVHKAFGCSEYEWCWTIKAEDVFSLANALDLDLHSNTETILTKIKSRFGNENAGDVQEFLIKHNILFETWSRMGD